MGGIYHMIHLIQLILRVHLSFGQGALLLRETANEALLTNHHVSLVLFFLKPGKCSFLRRLLSSSLSAVEFESVDRVSSSTDTTVDNSRTTRVRLFFSLESRELSDNDVFDRAIELLASSYILVASWLNDLVITVLSLVNGRGGIGGTTSSSPTVNWTSGGVSLPVSLLDESGGADDSFHARLSSIPASKSCSGYCGSFFLGFKEIVGLMTDGLSAVEGQVQWVYFRIDGLVCGR